MSGKKKTPMVKRTGFAIAMGTAAVTGCEREPTATPNEPAMAPVTNTPAPASLEPVPSGPPAELVPIPSEPAIVEEKDEEGAPADDVVEVRARMRRRVDRRVAPMIQRAPMVPPPPMPPPMPPPPMVDPPTPPMVLHPMPPMHRAPMVRRPPPPMTPEGRIEAPMVAPDED